MDCTGAGQGDLGVDITHNGKRVPAFINDTGTPRLFKVTYTPYDPGPYEVNVHFNRAEVRGEKRRKGKKIQLHLLHLRNQRS